MSWAFTIREEEYDVKTRTRIIKKVKKIYDVAIVHCGANPATSVSARDWLSGVSEPIMQEMQERAALIENIKRKVGKLNNDIIRQATTD